MGVVVDFLTGLPRVGAKPRLPTHHLPELVPLALPELVDLSSIRPAPTGWQDSPVLVKASLLWGQCIGMEPATGRLVVVHRIAGDVLIRSYLAEELRPLKRGDPRA